VPVNTIPTSFNVLYDATETIADYGLIATSTWILIDREGKVVYRENDNIEEWVIDSVKVKIDELIAQ